MASASPLVALVLCGGGGTRLWPISSEARPKQFLKLFGNRTLFQNTCARLEATGCDETVIITNSALESLARADLAEIGMSGARYVLEPARRDSGPAIAAGVADILVRHGADATILVVASDHLIPDRQDFAASVARGRELAARDRLVTFGIRPTFPATEYGYIQRGAPISGVESGFEVRRFHEKPRREIAETYLADPDFAWNSGNFMFRAGCFASEATEHMPDIWASAQAAVARGQRDGDRLTLEAASFSAARRVSIDFALFERSGKVGTISAAFAWSDIGGWQAVHAASPLDARGNARRGEASLRDCNNSLVFSDGPPIFGIGLEGFVVIASTRGVFVAPRERAQEIKAMLEDAPTV